MSEYLCRHCGAHYYGTHSCSGNGNWKWIDDDKINAIRAENAVLREQLRWRNTIDEQPAYYQEVLVRPRIAKRCISTFIYFDQFAEMFKRDYVEWLPIPEVAE
jgi:hypothetical protein